MSKDSNKKELCDEILRYNDTSNRMITSHDIFEDSEEIDASDSESIILDKKDERILKPSEYFDDVFENERKELSTDGEFKDSLREKKIDSSKKIIAENQFEESELIDDEIKKSALKSQILAHYKLGEDQEVFRIDIKSEKRENVSENRKENKPTSPHWQPIQIPADLFADEEIKEEKKNSMKRSSVRPFEYKSENESIKDKKKEEKSLKKDNLLNPFTYFNNYKQEENQTSSVEYNSFDQQAAIKNYQSQNSQFPSPQQMMQQQFPQNYPQIQYSQTANFIPPFSPRSDVYWQSGPPQQQYPSYQPFNGGAELMTEMRYLREEVKMLRDSMNLERSEREFQMRYKRENDKDLDKFEKIVFDMKKTIDEERSYHKKQIEEISSKFIDQITILRESNTSLELENKKLKMISESPYKESNLLSRLNFREREEQNIEKKSSRKIRNLQEILDKKMYTNITSEETIGRKTKTNIEIEKVENKKKPEKTPRKKRESEKKSF